MCKLPPARGQPGLYRAGLIFGFAPLVGVVMLGAYGIWLLFRVLLQA